MTVRDRLRLLRGPQSYKQFAEHLGWGFNSVRRYELGLARVPMEYVEAVCATLGVSADWLIFGVEAPAEAALRSAALLSSDGVRRDGRARTKCENTKRYTLIDGEKVRIVCVPVLNRVPAGPSAEMLDDMPVGFGLDGKVWVPDPQDPNAYGLTAWGDSMEPLIHHGETIIVSPRRRYDFLSGLAVVRIAGGEVCVKYVRRRPACAQRTGRVEVLSANPRYPRQSFPPGKVEVLGEVVFVVRSGNREN